jgi:hypothetical protein
MSLTRRETLAAAIGCALATMCRGDDKKPAMDEEVIKSFLAYLERNEIKLAPDPDGGWMVTDPKADGYRVIVYFRTFPEGTSEKDMRKALGMINLAFMLNAPSRLAMSYPGLRVPDPTKPIPKLDQIPAAVKLEKLFKDYRPPKAG